MLYRYDPKRFHLIYDLAIRGTSILCNENATLDLLPILPDPSLKISCRYQEIKKALQTLMV
jgi:hypothetical protein